VKQQLYNGSLKLYNGSLKMLGLLRSGTIIGTIMCNKKCLSYLQTICDIIFS
jgi:hypothetical protein